MSTLKGRMALLSLWFLPGWLVRWLPGIQDAAERQVYDGLTRHEWFTEQVRQCQEVNAKRAARSGSEADRG